MSLLSKAGLLRRIRRGKDARAKLVESNLDKGIAFQIRATRDKHEWSQADLARAIGMSQNNISRLENPDYGKYTLSSLKRIAEALDVALVVRFVPFSQYVSWLSGTPYLDEGLRPEALAVESFEQEEKRSTLDIDRKYWSVYNGQQYTVSPATGTRASHPLLDTASKGSTTPPIENTLKGQGFERVTA
jgi:transcriptional regulator with XRE-family HTH domain